MIILGDKKIKIKFAVTNTVNGMYKKLHTFELSNLSNNEMLF